MFDGARPGEFVETAPPRVTLRNAFAHPFDSAIAAARTCYAPRLISPEEITDKQRTNIGAATFHSGHHTVYQHAHFEFGLENVSRQFVWSFLHAHPFYNSEQQSQRYVRLDRAQAYVPAVSLFFDEKSKEIYEQSIARAWNYYRELSALLITDARTVIGAMVAHVKEIDAQFFDRFGTEPLEELPEWKNASANTANGEAFAREFDAKLNGKISRLVDYSPNATRVMAESYRAVAGLTLSQCSDAEALDRLLNPARNLYRLETLNVGVHAPMMRALQHANFTFAKKISHTADSQDQRHRMVPGSRPLLTLADTREPDYVTPMLLANNPRAKEIYDRAMRDAWTAKNQLLDRGVTPEIALYLLPNAKSIRLYESGSLLHLLHKWTMRTCFNAQEEIYQASMDEIAQLREVHPELTRYIGPPCHLRAGITTPICTEGSHFCGIKVWLDFPNISRRI